MIQIDMSMPTNCLECPACNEYLMCAIPINGLKWGENDVCEFDQGRPEWCPIKKQEAAEPKQVGLYGKDDWYGLICVCPDCKAEWMSDKADTHFCPRCGQKVKWE